MTTVLLLHPGEMGASIGKNLVSTGHRVLWIPQDRSEATRERADEASLESVSSLDEALEAADVVLSVCPPEFAYDVGTRVSSSEFNGIYCDGNAVAPSTAQTIQELFGSNYVDGGIVGPPPSRAGATRFYLSGRRAAEVEELFTDSLVDVRVLNGGNVAASAMKMCYAAYTKGTSALLLALRALAEANGVTEALQTEWNQSQPGVWQRSESAGPGISRKAWRFAPEMREIVQTFNDAGLPAGFHSGAAEIYEALSSFKDASPAHTRELIDALLSTESD